MYHLHSSLTRPLPHSSPPPLLPSPSPLKPGGEVYFSDVYSDLRVPEEARKNEMLWGECISGALQWEELMEIASEVGFSPPMLVEVSPVTVNNADLQSLLGVCTVSACAVVVCGVYVWVLLANMWYMY